MKALLVFGLLALYGCVDCKPAVLKTPKGRIVISSPEPAPGLSIHRPEPDGQIGGEVLPDTGSDGGLVVPNPEPSAPGTGFSVPHPEPGAPLNPFSPYPDSPIFIFPNPEPSAPESGLTIQNPEPVIPVAPGPLPPVYPYYPYYPNYQVYPHPMFPTAARRH